MASKIICYSWLDHVFFEQIWIEIYSALDLGIDCINEGLNTTVAIATKSTSKPQCGF